MARSIGTPRLRFVMRLRWVFLAVIVLPALLALAAAPSAEATWTAPVTIAPIGNGFDVAFDPSGNAIFAYQAYDSTCGCGRLVTRIRYANGTLGAPQNVSPTGAPPWESSPPSVAVDQSGNAVYVWLSRDGTTDCNGYGCPRVEVRVRFANGSLSATKTLSDPGYEARNPEVAVDPKGNATAVWFLLDFNKSIQARRRMASGTLGPLLTVGDPSKRQVDRAHVAVDQSGNAIFAFDQNDGSTVRVYTRVLSAGGALSAIQTLSAAGQFAGGEQVGVDQNGNAVYVWARADGTTDCKGSGCSRIQVRVRHPDGTISTVQTLSDPGQQSGDPFVAVNQAGTAAVVWTYETTASCTQGYACEAVQTRVRAAGGGLSAVQTLTSTKPDAGFASDRVGIDQNGNAVYVWRADSLDAIRARTRSSAGTLGTTKTLSGSGESPYDPLVIVRPTGTALAAWSDLFGPVEAAVGP